MRKNRAVRENKGISILALDDDAMMTLTLQSYFQSAGYTVDTENDPERAVERVREGNYDILLLDFLMTPICGDEVVARVREFNKTIFIVLLTGHKSLAPPMQTIRELDIQGYYEKSDRFDQLELLIESCVKSIRQMRTISNYRDTLRKIVDCNPALYRIQPIEEQLATIRDHLCDIFGSEACYVYVQDREAAAGEPEERFLGSGAYEGEIARARDALGRVNAAVGEPSGEAAEARPMELPLVDEHHRAFGMLGVALTPRAHPDAMPLFALYARQASGGLRNGMLHALLREQNRKLERAYTRLHDNYLEMTRAVRGMVDARDIYTRGHSDRVAHYAVRIAQAMGRDDAFVERIRVAGLFHDVGKIGVPDDILRKSTKLSEQEYALVKQHAVRGYQILAPVSIFQDVAPIVKGHHERLDGNGYPDGLRAGEIPLEARIISVADAFDAMTSFRRYRDTLDVSQAVAQLREGAGSQFDPEVVEVFIEILRDFEQMREQLAWTYTDEAGSREV